MFSKAIFHKSLENSGGVQIIELFSNSEEFQNLITFFSSHPHLRISFLPNSAKAFFLLALNKYLKLPVIFISRTGLETLYSDLTALRCERTILFQPTPSVLRRLLNLPEDTILLLSPLDLDYKIPALKDFLIILEKGRRLSYEQLINYLSTAGYYLTDFVTAEGEFARRGAIIDFFPATEQFPLRVEFFGDEIVSLRLFDPQTQRSLKELEEFELFLPQPNTSEGTPILSLLRRDAVFLVEDEGISVSRQFPLPAEESFPYNLPISFPNIYLGNFSLLKSEIARGDYQYYIVVPEYLQERLERILGSLPIYLSGNLSGGFLLLNTRVSLLTEKEIYGQPKIRPPKRRFRGLPVDELLALKKGDYVVHLDYGVGRFAGVKRFTFDNIEKDYLVINYAGDDKLYLPVESLGLIDRYISSEETPPKIDRIGRRDWAQAKNETEIHCLLFAKELLNLYARREITKGFAFSGDTDWQMELESSFPYAETPDQLKALKEIKEDMESERPMDRLICGDVGYGKTELALRAAFKAVCDFKQVALLAPTTILCLQHYNNFCARLKRFPVKVEMLSRLLRREEKERIIREIAEGKVDIVIGTHLLLSNKVSFKDLGLLIIDEEQRFGVRQKEKIKRIKENIDCLSLTATPIPRTLYMSLTGIKDISLINTPPLGRKEIITMVSIWDEAKIREAIMREVSAGGQVFFIHNRIQGIYKVEEKLKRICPEIKIGVAHAKMSEERLSRVYIDFLNKRYDLLLSTAIIESGIDMPNVNTIIVDEAQNFGLADLHQLRGRVGRSDRQGYCLFILPDKEELTAEAKRRIAAIVTYSQLGSGFQLALKDMEIRGIGNILGTEQHGHISRVGFNLYCQLLREAVKRLKGERITPEPELQLDIPSYIPEGFIPDSHLRVAVYKKILLAESEEEIEKLKEEIRDRFGTYPEIMENLFLIARVRIYAKRKGITKVSLKGNEIKIIQEGEEKRYSGDLLKLLKILKT